MLVRTVSESESCGEGTETMILKLSKEEKTQIITHIQRYFREERGEEIGELAAGFWLDFMIEQIGPFTYNQAISDIQVVLTQKMESLEEDIHALKIPIKLTYQKN